jgi:hypothetical protein
VIEEASRGWLAGCGVIITVKEKGEKYHPLRVVGFPHGDPKWEAKADWLTA